MFNYSLYFFGLEVLCVALGVYLVNKQNLVTTNNFLKVSNKQNLNNYNKISNYTHKKQSNNLSSVKLNRIFNFSIFKMKISVPLVLIKTIGKATFKVIFFKVIFFKVIFFKVVFFKVILKVKNLINKVIYSIYNLMFKSLVLTKKLVNSIITNFNLIIRTMKNLYKSSILFYNKAINLITNSRDIINIFKGKKSVYIKNNMVVVNKGSLSWQKIY